MATKKSPIMPSPFGAKPVFGNSAPKAEETAPASEVEEPEEGPRRFTVPVYSYAYRPTGIGPWKGTGNVVVKEETFDPPKGFDTLPTSEVTNGAVAVTNLIRGAVTAAGCVKYVRKAVLPVVYMHEVQEGEPVRIDAKVGVYVDLKTKRAIMLDQAFGPAPRSVFGPKSGDVHAVADASVPSAVRYIAACFAPRGDRSLAAARDLVVRGLINEAVALAHIACLADVPVLHPVKDKKYLAALEHLDQSLLSKRCLEAMKLFPQATGSLKGEAFLDAVLDDVARL